MTDHEFTPSPDALARAEAALPSLQRELAGGVRRRALRRSGAGAACAVALLLGATLLATLPSRAPRVTPAPAGGETVQAPSPEPTPLIQIVRSNDAPMIEVIRGDHDPAAIASLYATARVDLASILVSDSELLDLLESIGRPSGLVRTGGRVWLTAAVTDEEIEAQRRGIRDES